VHSKKKRVETDGWRDGRSCEQGTKSTQVLKEKQAEHNKMQTKISNNERAGTDKRVSVSALWRTQDRGSVGE